MYNEKCYEGKEQALEQGLILDWVIRRGLSNGEHSET